MARALLALAVCAATAHALEPREIYEAAAPGTVFLMRGEGGGASGVVVAPGWILTNEHVVRGLTSIRVRVKDGTELDASVEATDTRTDLALLKAEGLEKTGARTIRLAPVLAKADGLKASRVYAIGHPADPTDNLSMWKFTQGVVSNVRALSVPALKGLVLIEHDATIAPGNSGGPLLNARAELVGLNKGGWSAISKQSVNTYYSVPVNALRAFLAEQSVDGIDAPGSGTLTVFDKDAIRTPPANLAPAQAEPVAAPAPRVKIPPDLHFGRYTHFLKSKEEASLKRRAMALVREVRGNFYTCRTCAGAGTLRRLVRAGFWVNRETWVPPVYDTITCTNCKGAQEIFRKAKVESAFAKFARVENRGSYRAERDEFVERLHAARRNYAKTPRIKVAADGRYGTVSGARNDPFFPLEFKLLPKGNKYEWFLQKHDDAAFDAITASGSAVVGAVAAGDLLVLLDGTVVRLCGICIPTPDGKAPPVDLTSADRRMRELVARELLGETVNLERDKYTRMTCHGYPLVFVDVRGRDYAEDLLKRGLVRRHPKHRCARNDKYTKAETVAKKAGAGIWSK